MFHAEETISKFTLLRKLKIYTLFTGMQTILISAATKLLFLHTSCCNIDIPHTYRKFCNTLNIAKILHAL